MSESHQTFQVNSWLDGVPDRKSFPALEQDLSTDWLIVGAGFTGLAAARKLAQERPQDRIVLLDSIRAGEGSGSLSSGFLVSAGQFNGSDSFENKLLYRLGRVGLESLRKQVTANSIECGWNESGRLIGARGASGTRSMKMIKRVLEQIGSPYSGVHPDELKQQTGMEGYVSAIRQEESVLVNPALLLRGLVESLPDNVEIFENSKVVGLSPEGPLRATLEARTVTAGRVLVTNNAFALRLGLGRSRLIPMRTFVSIASLMNEPKYCEVPPLPGSDDRWGITSPERVGSSLRRVGNRLMIRNSAFFGYKVEATGIAIEELERVSQLQLKLIHQRFPNLDFKIENTWSGVIGVTANAGQIFGDLGNGLFVSAGYNGHGIAQGTVSGELLAELALGKQSSRLEDIQKIRRPSWIPAGPWLRLGVNAYARFLGWRFRDEI